LAREKIRRARFSATLDGRQNGRTVGRKTVLCRVKHNLEEKKNNSYDQSNSHRYCTIMTTRDIYTQINFPLFRNFFLYEGKNIQKLC
jgi:hypothetical protein